MLRNVSQRRSRDRYSGVHRKRWALVGALLSFTCGAFATLAIERSVDATTDILTPDLHVSLFADPSSFPSFDVVLPGGAERYVGRVVHRNSGTEVTRWAEAEGGAAADRVTFDLEVFGKVDHPVIITGVTASAKCVKAPADATLVALGQAGPIFGRVVEIDLDKGDMEGTPIATDDVGTWNFPLQVSRSEAERIVIIAKTKRQCTFNAKVAYSSAGTASVATVSHDGEPFRVTGSERAKDQLAWTIAGDNVTVTRPKP